MTIVQSDLHPCRQKNPTIQSGFLLLRQRDFLAQSIYRGPHKILCTCGEKEYTSKRVSIIARNNVISKAKCATCETATPSNSPLHAPLTRVNSPVLAVRRMLSFSKTRGAEEMFVAEQQLTSLSPRREILCNQTMIARSICVIIHTAL